MSEQNTPARLADRDWAAGVLRFWFEELGPSGWFKKSDATDAEITARFEELHREAAARLESRHTANVELFVGDVMRGWQPEQAHDVVVVTGSVPAVPEAFLGWVNPGGRMFVVKGESPAMEACLMVRQDVSEWTVESLFANPPTTRWTDEVGPTASTSGLLSRAWILRGSLVVISTIGGNISGPSRASTSSR